MNKRILSQKSETPCIPLGQKFEEDVRYFQQETGWKFEKIGRNAVQNARMWQRFLDGGDISLRVADRVYDYMETQGYYFNR